MSTVLFALLMAAALLLRGESGGAWRRSGPRHGFLRLPKRRSHAARSHAVPNFVRQLAALLACGRTGPELWAAMALVMTGTGFPPGMREPAGRAGVAPDAMLVTVIHVERASRLGMASGPAIRSLCAVSEARSRASPGLTDAQRRVWIAIAACFDVCERSGAPVAGVLERLAMTLEAEQDGAALRATALAGPQATVRLLTVLPFLGLGLGFLMGVNPFAFLVGSPVGVAVLLLGVGLVIAGRKWSAWLIVRAAGTADGLAAASAKQLVSKHPARRPPPRRKEPR